MLFAPAKDGEVLVMPTNKLGIPPAEARVLLGSIVPIVRATAGSVTVAAMRDYLNATHGGNYKIGSGAIATRMDHEANSGVLIKITKPNGATAYCSVPVDDKETKRWE